MTPRRVVLASLIFLVLLASFSVLPGQPSPSASTRRQTPQFGRIEISTAPGRFPLLIDGQPAGETTVFNRSIDIPPGVHTIEVVFPGGLRWRRELSVRSGQKICIALTYHPAAPGVSPTERPPRTSRSRPPASAQGTVSQSIVNCGEMATAGEQPPDKKEETSIILRSPRRRPASTPQPTPEIRPTPLETIPSEPMPDPSESDPPIIVGGGNENRPTPPEEPVDSTGPPPPPPPNLPRSTRLPPPPPEPTRTQKKETEKPKKEAEKPKDEAFTVVPIFYGTDRARTGAKEPRDFYGAGRGKLEMGTCEISIPKTHVRGQLESPSIWRLEFKEDPKLHVVLLNVKPLDAGEFNSQFQTKLGEAKSRDVFVFIHGYNVKFVDAARRTAQLSYDLQFPGVPVLYSWPSQGTLSGYTTDENEIVWTEPHLKKFLADLKAQAGDARIHLVAHSMGNRALTNVLRQLATENATPLFSEVILTAPDIDAEVFEQQLAPAIQKIARHVTLYASSSDAALLASKKVHGYQRAGDSLPTILIVPGVDTVDASGIDTDMLGHSYFAQMKDVMDDIGLLLIAGKLPSERSLLEQAIGSGKYWRLPAAIVTQSGERPGMLPGASFLTVRNMLILAVAFVAFVAIAVWLVLRARRRRAAAVAA